MSKPCNCRNKSGAPKKPTMGVATPSSIRISPSQITGCLGAAEAPTGRIVYGFNDTADAQAFVKYLASTYRVNAVIQTIRG